MRFVKMLGLAAIAAAALMAFIGASTASAIVFCSAVETPCVNNKWPVGTELDFSSTESTLLKETGASGETLDTCKSSTVKGVITNAGGLNTPVSGHISELKWNECTWTTTTNLNGGLQVTSTGGATSANAEIRVTISIPFFGSCVYGVIAGTSIGTLTGGNPATFDANAVASKLSGSSITCPSTANWTGKYKLTVPSKTTLDIEPE